MCNPRSSIPAGHAEPKDLSHHLSRSTKARQLSNIKQFYKYFAIPGIGQLAGGTFYMFLAIIEKMVYNV
jgi:hypothetical protein